jgi:hypothetical protein
MAGKETSGWLPGDGVSPFSREAEEYRSSERDEEAIRKALENPDAALLKERCEVFLQKVREGLSDDERVGELTCERLSPWRLAQMEWASVNRGLQKKLVELWVKERVKGILRLSGERRRLRVRLPKFRVQRLQLRGKQNQRQRRRRHAREVQPQEDSRRSRGRRSWRWS